MGVVVCLIASFCAGQLPCIFYTLTSVSLCLGGFWWNFSFYIRLCCPFFNPDILCLTWHDSHNFHCINIILHSMEVIFVFFQMMCLDTLACSCLKAQRFFWNFTLDTTHMVTDTIHRNRHNTHSNRHKEMRKLPSNKETQIHNNRHNSQKTHTKQTFLMLFCFECLSDLSSY